ncbi:MAG TPA: twin-arginine translocase subunit TatC [Myxococcaceae bacterium]|nr:twin-arginine translocase subunit TatC [Myxococcaceae bacterium]
MSLADRLQGAPEGEGQEGEGAGELRMSLSDHLEELRGRLLKCVVAVCVLAVVGLVFSRPIFGILMRPVLQALPEEARSLIYTSGIEEINVLMKVGLYAGIFLTTPVILWQIWGFVSPGLYPSERRFAAPFVFFGSLAFVTGAAFCYFMLLPTMFKFLLTEGDSAPLEERLESARTQEAEALRYLRFGDAEQAGAMAAKATEGLTATGEGKTGDGAAPTTSSVEMTARVDALGRMVDAVADWERGAAKPVLRTVMEKRLEALGLREKGDLVAASKALDQAAAVLASAAPTRAEQIASVWKLEKAIASGASRYHSEAWTRPMLTMSEQLSLVLLLELALGIIFEMPLVMALLAVVGLVKSRWLFKYQRHAIIVCLIIAAVITPTGDAINLSLMAGPMILCYEIGVLAVWLVERRRARMQAAEAGGGGAITQG